MIRILLYIKENFKLIWTFIEWLNGQLFKLIYKSDLHFKANILLSHYSNSTQLYRQLKKSDLVLLNGLLLRLEKDKLKFFEAHLFDLKSLKLLLNNPSLIMMGVFVNNELVGYFFQRCFINKRCFVGRLVDKNHRGKGIGKRMNEILYNTAWDSGFRCFATISKNNNMIIKAHENNRYFKKLKELKNDYLLVEFIKTEK